MQDRDMPDKKPIDFAALFREWPTPADLAADMGAPISRVRQWMRRETLDVVYWPQFVKALRGRGRRVTYEDLIAAASRRGDTRIDACRRSVSTRSRAKGIDRQHVMLANLCASGYGLDEMTRILNAAFGLTLSRGAVRGRMQRLNLRLSSRPSAETGQGAEAA